MSNEELVTVIDIDGYKGVSTPVGCLTFDEVPKAIHDGLFDEHRGIVPYVVKAYLKAVGKPDDSCLLPILRYYLACDAVDWVRQVSGGPLWTCGNVTMPVSLSVMRIAFAAQIEGDLAVCANGGALEAKAYTYYMGMKDWGTTDGLNDFGKTVVKNLLDTTAKAYADIDQHKPVLH